ncbi:WXG100 family type VII secretion target [Streptomyces sp. NPDC002573]|uniref:WXG100 family type VII secretion target n=1 Tax=Streptomyces sp. NPDC002573 TaxID=3364651 RepID=UPI00369E8F52
MVSPDTSSGFNFVDTNAMRQAVSRFEDTDAALLKIRANVEGQLAVLSTAFTGETATNYNRLMAEWTSKFETIRQKLSAMNVILKDNTAFYERASAENLATVDGLRPIMADPAHGSGM